MSRLVLLSAILLAVCTAAPARAVEVLETTDAIVEDVILDTWLDPHDPFWQPRRGERVELFAAMGGEGSFRGVAPDQLPTLGGVVVNGGLRYYPRARRADLPDPDRLALTLAVRAYLGLNGVPATGTTASTVISGITGVRYDLVRENRFSLLWDLYSGPSLFVFADLVESGLSSAGATYSIGGEMGTALAMRYSLGPIAAEVRGFLGGRAGASTGTVTTTVVEEGSPFSALYAGLDLGLTWSL
jgi:hypothetical protein